MEIRTYPSLRGECWSTAGCAKAIGAHRNTVTNWYKMSIAGEMDMPILSDKKPFRIPIDEFLEWYKYHQN